MLIHVFGASTGLGKCFIRKITRDLPQSSIYTYSRNPNLGDPQARFIDLSEHSYKYTLEPSEHHVFISFSPIWLFAPFVEAVLIAKFTDISRVSIICCSSSSSITKRFAFCSYDSRLARSLRNSEEVLASLSKKSQFTCTVVQPSLIYGSIDGIPDRNVSMLKSILTQIPFLLLPANTGQRQPIHISQLASVFCYLLKAHLNSDVRSYPLLLPIGGDDLISYSEFLSRIFVSSRTSNSKSHLRILNIPPRLFYFLASPVILFSPRYYEAILRIGSNLSGFTRCSDLLGVPPCSFPLPDD